MGLTQERLLPARKRGARWALRPLAIGTAAVSVAVGLAGCVVGTGNPNGCTLFADNPHESSTNPGTLSANVRVTCATAPAQHRTRMSLYRSPVGAYDWDWIGGNTWLDGATTSINHDLHNQNIQCPGGEFDYQTVVSHEYRNGPNFDYKTLPITSRVVKISC